MKNKSIGPRKITRSVLESDAPKKKKKKGEKELPKPGKELSVVIDAHTGEVTKKEVRAIKSTFGNRADTIMEMIEMGDEDGGLTLLKKALLQATVRILPMAEQIMENTQAGKGTYQFVTLVSQIRELITDIQADQDRKYIARSLSDNIIRPAFMDLAQDVITDHHVFRSAVEPMLKPGQSQEFNQALSKMAKQLAIKMSAKYKEIEQKTFEALKS